MKPGRNDPCPCGSGKKHKHCCLALDLATSQSPEQQLWRRIRSEMQDFPRRMFGFLLDAYGASAVLEAWDEFTLWDGSYGDFDSESPQLSVFMPWMYHCWTPEAEDTAVVDTSLHGIAPTRAFLLRKGRHFSPLHRNYLEVCLEAPFGFFEISHTEPGRGMRLRDFCSGEAVDVLEASASRSLRSGDLLFGQVVRLQGIAMLEACSPVAIPPQCKVELIRLRQELQSGVDDEASRSDALREHYLAVSYELLNPTPPMLRNTDGEDLMLQRLTFEVDSAQLAFDRLRHLDLASSEADLLHSAQYDADGSLRRVRFPWLRLGNAQHANWDNTVLGNVEIDGTRLSLQVNSEARAIEGRRLIEAALGDGARYRATDLELPEESDFHPPAGLRAPAEDPEVEAMLSEPAVHAQIADFMARHFDSWPEEPLPALGGRTPIEAVNDADGREMVEALVQQMERASTSWPLFTASSVLQRLRLRLGLLVAGGARSR